MFKLKEQKIKHMKDIFEIEANNIALMVQEKIGSGFEHLCEIDNLHNDIHNLNLTIKELETENRFKEEQLIKLDEKYQKLYDYAYKLATIVQSDNQKLLDEIADLKSDHYVKVKVPEGKTPGKQKIGAKSSAKTSKIIKKVKDN